eukprot:6562210-Pyramimonas_sp.AAC.1
MERPRALGCRVSGPAPAVKSNTVGRYSTEIYILFARTLTPNLTVSRGGEAKIQIPYAYVCNAPAGALGSLDAPGGGLGDGVSLEVQDGTRVLAAVLLMIKYMDDMTLTS